MRFARVSEMLTNGERGVLVTVLQSTPLFQSLQGTHWIWCNERFDLVDGQDQLLYFQQHLGSNIQLETDPETVRVKNADIIQLIEQIVENNEGKIESVGETVLTTESQKSDKHGDISSTADQYWGHLLTQLCGQVLEEGEFRRQQVQVTDQWLDLILEPILPQPRLIILGAGHVGQALARLAHLVELPVILVDDRPDFANGRLFPEGIRVICDDFLRVIDQIQLTEHDYLVIVTRGHQYDRNCLIKVAGMKLAYVGMIGSRRRVKRLFAELEKQGIDPVWLEQVHSPIGLDIGADTPQEIGVSILAELIQVRRKGAR